MNESTTLSLTDYVVEIGNQFFHLDENDWNVEQNELSYETTDRAGFNGYVLKIEETADNYSHTIITNLVNYLSVFYAFICKHIQKKKTSQDESKSQGRRNASTQTAINKRVRSRLLDVINEDVEKWNRQKSRNVQRINYQKRKNQFKNSMEYEVTTHKSIFDYLGFTNSFPKKE